MDTWVLDPTETGKITGDGDQAMIEAMEAVFTGTNITYKFNEDKSAVIIYDMSDSVSEAYGTWETDENIITIRFDDNSVEMSYTFDNDILVVEMDRVKLAFKRQ